MQIAAGDRLEARAHRGASVLARRRDHVLEVQQVRHERMQVAFDPHQFLLDQREHVGEAGRRQRLPEFLPDLARGAQRKAVIGRDEWARRRSWRRGLLDADQ